MLENLLAAFYLETGGEFRWEQDIKDGYSGLHMEPRYHLGAGLSFDATDRIEVDMGWRWSDMPYLPGRVHDALDKSHSLYLEIRVRPFRKN
jgi:opacity protein-like surface antigen